MSPLSAVAQSHEYNGLCLPSLLDIQNLWVEVLGLELAHIRPDAHFMLLGGDSLQLQRLLYRLQEDWGIQLGIDALVLYCTPARMHQYCQYQGPACYGSKTFVFEQDSSSEFPVPATALGLWLADQSGTPAGIYNCALLVDYPPVVNFSIIESAVRQVLLKHPVLCSKLVWNQNQRQFTHRCLALPEQVCELVQFTGACKHQVKELAGQELRLDAGLPCRFYILQDTSKKRLRLLLVCHHAVMDGWSGRVLAMNLLQHTGCYELHPRFEQDSSKHVYASWCQRQLSDHADKASLPPRVAGNMQRNQVRLPLFPVTTSLTQLQGPFSVSTCTGNISRRQWLVYTLRASQLHLSLFTACCRAFALTMACLTGLPELSFAVPVNQRSRRVEELSVGCYLKVQVCQLHELLQHQGPEAMHHPQVRPFLQLQEEPNQGQLQQQSALQQQHLQLQTDLANPALSLDRLACQPGIERLPSGQLLTDLLFAFQNFPTIPCSKKQKPDGTNVQKPAWSGHTWAYRLTRVQAAYSDYALTCEISPEPAACRIQLRYATTVFNADQMQQVQRNFRLQLARLLA